MTKQQSNQLEGAPTTQSGMTGSSIQITIVREYKPVNKTGIHVSTHRCKQINEKIERLTQKLYIILKAFPQMLINQESKKVNIIVEKPGKQTLFKQSR